MVGLFTVETGQLPALQTTYWLPNTPSLNQRCCRLMLKRSLLQVSVASNFQFGVLPALTPAPSVGIAPIRPVFVVKCRTLVARARTVKLPGRPIGRVS